MMDIDGLLVKDRPEGHLEGHKIWYAKDYRVMKNLLDVVREIKPSVLIGKRRLFLWRRRKESRCNVARVTLAQALRQRQDRSHPTFSKRWRNTTKGR